MQFAYKYLAREVSSSAYIFPLMSVPFQIWLRSLQKCFGTISGMKAHFRIEMNSHVAWSLAKLSLFRYLDVFEKIHTI